MSYTSVDSLFAEFGKQKILVIGDVMVDAYIWGSVERISPEAPVPIVRATKRDYRLGGAGNVALNIHALGATPVLCTLLGQDENGDKIIQRMQDRGMSTEGIIQTADRPTTVKTRIISGHQHVVRIDEETDRPADKKDTNLLLEKINHLLPDCDAIVFEDYDKGVITPTLIEKTIAKAQELNITVTVDPKKRNFLRYKGATLFKPNLKELREGLKLDQLSELSDIQEAVEKIKDKLNLKGVLTTLSEKGAYISLGKETYHAPAHVREISDVSGAGDTVVSIASLCMALELSPKLTVQLSNLAGGLVCEHSGVVPIDKVDFKKEAAQFFQS